MNSSPRRKIALIFGTRPEAIKMAPVVKALCSQSDIFEPIVIATAQHREMMDQVLKIFQIKPAIDLNIMRPEQSLSDVLHACVTKIGKIFEKLRPDIVLVQGDTTSTFAGALSAFYHKIPVGHVEAGLRTGDKYRPFPEEINRRLTTQLTDVHFPPTSRAKDQLLREGISPESIYLTGNTVVDALLQISGHEFDIAKLGIRNGFLDKKLVLVTVHRRESFGEPIRNVCRAVRRLAEEFAEEISVFIPAHRNPEAWNAVHEVLGKLPNVMITSPIEYLPLVHLLKRANFVITDSGGIQEEAPTFGKPVLVAREKTERPEGIDAGVVELVGLDENHIFSSASRLLRDKNAYDKMSRVVNPYGDGKAAVRIVGALKHFFGFTSERPSEFRAT